MIDWIADSSTSLTPWKARVLILSFLLVPVIYFYQNGRSNRLGGPISWAKSLWLSYVLTVWFLIPGLLMDSSKSMIWLLASMLIRAAIEVPLCLTHRWRVSYGIFHDLAHMGLVSALWSMKEIPIELAWIFYLTLISLVCEIAVVFIFKKATGGPENGYFFVSNQEKFRGINQISFLVSIPQIALFASIISMRVFPL